MGTYQAYCNSNGHPLAQKWYCKRRPTKERAEEDVEQHLEKFPSHKGSAGVLPTAGAAEDGPCDYQDDDDDDD